MALDPNRVQEPVRKVRKLIKKMPRQPSPEDVHDLRTNTRKIEAALRILSLDNSRRGGRLLKSLSCVRRRASPVRDMDVLTSYAASLKIPGEDDCKIQLLEHLGSTRRRKAHKLRSAVSRHAAPLRSGLKKMSDVLDDAVDEGKKYSSGRGRSSSQAAAAALALESELAETRDLGRRNLHPYRLKVKELRNVLRMADNNDEQFVATLGRVKDVIGEWHDWEELHAIAGKKLDHGAGCKLIREIKETAQKKFDHALAETETMRKKYFGIWRSGTKRRGRKIPTQRAWKATAGLAA